MKRVLLFVALGAVLAPHPAEAASTKYLWATINRCDNAQGALGIRASMPGNGTSQRMYMRFSAQFRNTAGRFVETGSSTRWIRVGTARRRSVQSGYDFAFAAPDPGTSYLLRGTVGFRWTAKRGKRWKVVRNETRITSGGIKGVEGSSPPGKSEGLCLIRR